MKNIKAPIAKKVHQKLEKHGDVRIDNYFWMRLSDDQKNAKESDEQTKDVLEYLNAENDYLEEKMSDTKEFQNTLFEEMKSRIKEDDSSVPYVKNGYYYIVKYKTGLEYPIYSRKKSSLENKEELLLDVNELAKNHSYYNVHSLSVSPNNKLFIFGEDTVSRRIYTLRFKDLKGDFMTDEIKGTTGYGVWANDNQTVFYAKKDESLRSYKIFRHKLGTPQSKDVEVYHEKDDTFSTFVTKTKSGKYLVIGSKSTVSDEYRVLDAENPLGGFKLFQERIKDLEYDISHHSDKWYIRTNEGGAFNFKIDTCLEGKTSKEFWQSYIEHKEDVLISDIDIFNKYLVVSERIGGNTTLRVIENSGNEYGIDFPDDAYFVFTSSNFEFNTDILRLKYSSLTTPMSTFDFNMETKERSLLKEVEVLGDFDKNNYTSERINIVVRDGIKVSVSLVYRKDTTINENTPVLLYGYGSYGISIDPYFSSARLSLLDRGFVFALAHIRGGQEMGRKWYFEGKLLKKKNTFFDFIDIAKYLIENKYTSNKHLYAMGGSAGGLLMGAVINYNPSLWNGVIAAVPFVDVISTMLDDTIPLTTGEYDEWGNPNDEKYYHYIKSYSPLDNIEKKNYPNLLITTGYWDSQVQYWEPAKWIAKLRDLKTGNNLLIMHCDMETGHGGASGRFKRLKEVAMEYAFLLKLEDKIG